MLQEAGSQAKYWLHRKIRVSAGGQRVKRRETLRKNAPKHRHPERRLIPRHHEAFLRFRVRLQFHSHISLGKHTKTSKWVSSKTTFSTQRQRNSLMTSTTKNNHQSRSSGLTSSRTQRLRRLTSSGRFSG